jgi:hypothetical protein
MELAAQLSYWLGCIQQCSGRVSAKGDDNLGIDYLDLSLQVGQAAYYLFGPGIAIFGRATL